MALCHVGRHATAAAQRVVPLSVSQTRRVLTDSEFNPLIFATAFRTTSDKSCMKTACRTLSTHLLGSLLKQVPGKQAARLFGYIMRAIIQAETCIWVHT